MLEMTDTPILPNLSLFAVYEVEVAFLVPTPTGYKKSIMDAIKPVRELLLNAGIHSYEDQHQGQLHKKVVPASFVLADVVEQTTASLYRPETKSGDPRIWFRNLKKYCSPCNLLGIVATSERLYVFNLSDPKIVASIKSGAGARVLASISHGFSGVAEELLYKMRMIHREGFIPGINYGDTSVGMTLEHALGIEPNSSRTPDYHGIEIKAGRIKKSKNRVNLFSQVPDWKRSNTTSKKILSDWGYMAFDKHGNLRLSLNCTVEANYINPQGLFFDVDNEKDLLINRGLKTQQEKPRFVAQWDMALLRKRLAEKHRETFWVVAESQKYEGKEHFRYDRVVHSKKPNLSYLGYLIEDRKITMDYLMHLKQNGTVRDHGFLFKIHPDNINLLFPNPVEYDLGID